MRASSSGPPKRFDGAAAEVLAAFTGSAFFPGGVASYTAPANRFLTFEKGPTTDVRLEWATYFDAADQAGQSRLWGGIHIAADDFKVFSPGLNRDITSDYNA